MRPGWLWDRKISDRQAKSALKKPGTPAFTEMAALLLARNNVPHKVFKDYIDPLVFCRNWNSIKKRMRQDSWTEPRIIFWQAIYERLAERYRAKGIVFRNKTAPKDPFCESVGRKIAVMRRQERITQKELAKRLGVSQQLVSRVESGGENMSISTLNKIARSLKKTIRVEFI